jgi:hypothetical protein
MEFIELSLVEQTIKGLLLQAYQYTSENQSGGKFEVGMFLELHYVLAVID